MKRRMTMDGQPVGTPSGGKRKPSKKAASPNVATKNNKGGANVTSFNEDVMQSTFKSSLPDQ